MSTLALKTACHDFAQLAAPYLQIKDADHYEETLVLIESLMEDAADDVDDPMNAVIDMLAHSIEAYENRDIALADFETNAMTQSADLAMLRLLMDQYNLGTADLPEIGSKSMVSRVLSGERQLNKKHIKALSDRFGIDPGLFF
jgi:HTH-type transcriptional regulator / antitoxin HigA